MNRITLYLIFVLNICLLSSCSKEIQTSSYSAAGTNFSNYKTYAWVAPGDTTLNTKRDDKIYAGLIQASADKQITKKGLTLDNQNPDAVFMFDTQIDEKLEYSQRQVNTNLNAGYTYGYGGFGYGYVGSGYYASSNIPIYENEFSAVPIDEGTLTYSMFDRKTGKLLWKGVAKQKLDAKTNIERSIKSATNYIFIKLHVK